MLAHLIHGPPQVADIYARAKHLLEDDGTLELPLVMMSAASGVDAKVPRLAHEYR